MYMKVHVIVDSTADMAEDIRSRLKIVPLTVTFGEEEYIDGVTIDHKTFYEKLVETDVMPTTSQATPAAFAELFEEITAAGESAVVITLASRLSGTYQSAVIAAEGMPDIHVVDGRSVAIGTGILAEHALELADQGRSAAEIADEITELREKVRIVAMLDTLEYLKRGGRISGTVAFAGGLLNIKPVVSLVDGEIVVLGRARGSRQGNNLLVTEIDKAGGVDFDMPVLLGYTGISDLLLLKYVADSAALWQESKESLRSTPIGSVIGTHAGPGAIAAAFFKKEG